MKFPSLVGTDYKDFTKEEVKALEDKFGKLIKEYTNKDFVVSSSIHQERLDVNITFPIIHNQRNIYKDRIIKFSRITFMVRKHGGYLDKWDFTFKETNVTTDCQYSCFIRTDGIIIPYKCRRVRSFILDDIFQFGTELEDIDYHKALNYLFGNILKF